MSYVETTRFEEFVAENDRKLDSLLQKLDSLSTHNVREDSVLADKGQLRGAASAPGLRGYHALSSSRTAAEDQKVARDGTSPLKALPSEEVQAEYRVIVDTVQKVKLPPDCILPKGTQGVTKETRTAHNIATSCAKYTETALKLIVTLFDKDEVSEDDLGKLLVVQYAEMKYLQDELASIIVQGQFDNTTTKLFRSIQKNTSVFSSEALENLKSAASIAAAGAQQQQGSQRGRGRWGRGRGGFNRDRQNQDYYTNATSNHQFNRRQPASQNSDQNE